jgi:hypothetical protein
MDFAVAVAVWLAREALATPAPGPAHGTWPVVGPGVHPGTGLAITPGPLGGLGLADGGRWRELNAVLKGPGLVSPRH